MPLPQPANILVNLDGEPKITDFGISAFINSTLAVVSVGIRRGGRGRVSQWRVGMQPCRIYKVGA